MSSPNFPYHMHYIVTIHNYHKVLDIRRTSVQHEPERNISRRRCFSRLCRRQKVYPMMDEWL